jgi:microsomal epoxide hydrolase/non-specific protein-tyrosine kinase
LKTPQFALPAALARGDAADEACRMSGFPPPRFLDAAGVRLAVYEAGEGAPVVLVHGWPEIAYSWKNQLPALAAAGFRAIAIDLKGFGRSDAPPDKALYDVAHMTGDFVAVLDALSIDRAVFCGHDWGGLLVWPTAILHPERVLGVVGVCTPHRAPPAPPLALIEKRFGPQHYILQFQNEGPAEALFESDIEGFFRFVFRKTPPREAWPKLIPQVYDLPGRFARRDEIDASRLVMSEDDIAVYVEAYRRTGFRPGINLYRNIDANWRFMKDRDPVVRAPALFVGADLDLFLPPELAEGMERLVPDLEKRILSGCGHWVMWEKPAELNEALTGWLARRIV